MQADKEARFRGGNGEGAEVVDITAVNKRRNGFARLSILTQVLALFDKEWEVQVCRVPRRVNRVADGLAKVTRFDSLDCDIFEAPLDAIVDLLRLDALEA
ncbi:hypothetical protein V6N13_145765 [Hibiscus sabdariffa]